ncbi:MAG: ferrous iron transporter B [Rhodocyclaceae bacterium]|nr:ferrous iron transporter B [Rhodocyclaceae bacterium]
MSLALHTFPLRGPIRRGGQAPRIALVGRPGTGKTTLFEAVASTEVRGRSAFDGLLAWRESLVEIGVEQAWLSDLPSLDSLMARDAGEQALADHLLRGVPGLGGVSQPDVLIQVLDATALERELELSQELAMLGRPLVIALNRLDEAGAKGLRINVEELSKRLGAPVVPTIAHMGKGISALFQAALDAARKKLCPLPQPASPHIVASLEALCPLLARPEIDDGLQLPRPLLLMRIAAGDKATLELIERLVPGLPERLASVVADISRRLPRPLAEELHADRHHRAAVLYEAVTRQGHREGRFNWRHALDELFLHPHWGLLGSLAVFGLVLFMVFEVSTAIDRVSSAPLGAWVATWQPASTAGVIGRAVADGMVGLAGIVLPYMLPLVMLLVALEESGVMHRVAFVVDRGFHHIGLHGGVAVPFLLGLGCNVPAITAATQSSSGRERVVAALLITFVPCSARSAIMLAVGGKYLGVGGVLGLFALNLLVIALAGRLLARRYGAAGPGVVQTIPPYALPKWRPLLATTWERTSDIVTIVTPLLVAGSIVLALLEHWHADATVNALLEPVTHWWLGLPPSLGVPILFGVLRKELSLAMVQQALGTPEIGDLLDSVQIATFLIFLTFYVPCVSTFAVMLRTLGKKRAFASVGLSVAVALVLSGAARLLLGAVRMLAG